MVIEIKNKKNIFNISIPGVLVRNCGKYFRLEISLITVKRMGIVEILSIIYKEFGTEEVVWSEY